MTSLSSNSSSEDFAFQDSWETELELALLEHSDLTKIRSICQLRPVPPKLRRDLWRLCLNSSTAGVSGMSDFTDTFDLPSQESLHDLCSSAVASVIADLSADDVNTSADDSEYQFLNKLPSTSQLCSDFESVLTHFSHAFVLPFVPEGNCWVQLLATLYAVLYPVSRNELYTCFVSLVIGFIPFGLDGSVRACIALRLLLQYHEPELCNFLDSHKLGPELYAKPWLESLFSEHVMHETLLALWDVCFLMAEPHFSMLVTLVSLVNAKSALMTTYKSTNQSPSFDDNRKQFDEKNSIEPSHEDLLSKLISLQQPMQIDDIEHLVPLTLIYARNTPLSFRTNYLPILFGTMQSDSDDLSLKRALSLMISVDEILNASHCNDHKNDLFSEDVNDSSNSLLSSSPSVRFLLVDCRPADQYNAGHLSTAFYLDTEVMLSNPPEFNTIVQALLQSQQRGIASGSKAAGEHIAFLGSGRSAEDRLANMVVAHFLRLNIRYVSFVNGGYAAMHDSLSTPDFNLRIVSHEPDLCFVCAGKEGLRMADLAHKSRLSSIPCGAPLPDSRRFQSIGGESPFAMFSRFSTLLKKSVNTQSVTCSENRNLNPETSKGLTVAPIAPQTASNSTVSYRNTAAVFSIDDNDDYDIVDSDLSFNPTLWKHSLPPVGNVKSIDKEHEVLQLEHCTIGQMVDFTACRFRPEVLSTFDCKFFNSSGQLSDAGVILLLVRHFIVVQEKRGLFSSLLKWSSKSASQSASKTTEIGGAGTQNKSSVNARKNGHIIVSIPLSSMIRITSNKKVPEVITFHYQPTDIVVSESLSFIRLFIPKAGDAVKEIKLAVFKVNNIDNSSAL